MIGASKILTVSYGTFSCTLEGFDEPFNTMKAIAEYFRDLAAEDRYFGAEPPTPDAAMLHKIAEREIQRRVEAKIQDNGVILRAADADDAPQSDRPTAPSLLAEPARLAPTVSDRPTLDGNGDSAAERLARLRANQTKPDPIAAPEPAAVQILPVAAVDQPYDDDYDDEQASDDAGVSVLDSYAALTATAPVEDLYITDDSGFEDFSLAEEVQPPAAQADQDAASHEAESDELSDMVDDQPEADAAPLIEEAVQDSEQIEPENHEVAASAEMLLADSLDDSAETVEAETDAVGYYDPKNADQLIEDADQDTATDDDDSIARMLASVGSATATAEVEDYDDEATQVLDHDADVSALIAADTAEPDAPTEHAEESTLSAEQALAEALGIDAPQARAMIEDDDIAALDEEPAEKPLRARARVIKVRRIQPVQPAAPAPNAETSLLSDEAEAALQAELAALEEDAPVDTAESAPQTVRPTRPTRPVRPETAQAVATDTDDTALSASLRGLMDDTASDDAETATQAQDSRHVLTDLSEDDAVSRLMAQTNTAMDDPESRRRTMAISHLKAAVAATEADRQVLAANPAKPQPDRKDIYRNDLDSVVRIKPTDAPRADRPSPLVLVSEQRIDRVKAADAPRVVMPTRPTRVITPAAAFGAQDSLVGGDLDEDDSLSAEEASANLFSAGQSFADFAEQLGAESLHDLLEAAAVYCAQILGRPQFSRPMVMSQINTLPQAEDHKLEEQLRAFGTLMREGRITKVKRGAFAVTDRSPLLAEALRNAS
ncbi:MAG: hypothetical protein ACOH2M_15730 [Cypionkella sp.]